jgi:hypothetical protein
MPAPSSSLATLRPELAGSLEEFNLAMDREGFIAHRVLPVFEVMVASGVFGRIPIEQLLQNRETSRAPRAGYSRGTYQFTTDSFACKEYGAEEPVDDREAKLYANYFDAEMIATQRAIDAVMRDAERRVSALIFNATTWTGSDLTTGVTDEWDDLTNATPITDVEAAVRKVYANTGLWANALIINRLVFRNLRNCAKVIDRIMSLGAGNPAKPSDVTTQMLAQVFDLPYILVAGGTENTKEEGLSFVGSPLWSNEYAMVARIATTNDISEPCLGRTFHWSADGSTVGGTIESYRDETIRANVIRARHDVHEKVLYVECGHLLSNITT